MDLVLAKSKAGHDKDEIYVIVNEDNDSYLLANGSTKTMANPKKKKKIHVQIIKSIPDEIQQITKELSALDDLSIKRILKVYNRRNIKNV